MNKLNNQDGQSTIEFIITFGFSIGITFLFLGMAINYVVGYMVHYGTFMAARTYHVYDLPSANTEEALSAAKNAAERKYRSYNLERFDAGVDKMRIISPETNPLLSGVVVTFERKVSFVKFVTGEKNATLVSEALLGKEPLRRECLETVCQAMGVGTCSDQMDVTVEDNGC